METDLRAQPTARHAHLAAQSGGSGATGAGRAVTVGDWLCLRAGAVVTWPVRPAWRSVGPGKGAPAMPYLQTVPPQESAGEVKALYDADLAAQGYVANYTQAFSLRPEVLRGWQALKDAITAGMEPRLYELATVAAASAIRSSYCSLVHGRILATSYYPAEAVASIGRNFLSRLLITAPNFWRRSAETVRCFPSR